VLLAVLHAVLFCALNWGGEGPGSVCGQLARCGTRATPQDSCGRQQLAGAAGYVLHAVLHTMLLWRLNMGGVGRQLGTAAGASRRHGPTATVTTQLIVDSTKSLLTGCCP
jgi:hypothetical protein